LEFYALELLFSPVYVQNLKFIHFTFYTFHYRPVKELMVNRD
jgi:hypothetical protein